VSGTFDAIVQHLNIAAPMVALVVFPYLMCRVIRSRRR
jgi:hypothetical protein